MSDYGEKYVGVYGFLQRTLNVVSHKLILETDLVNNAFCYKNNTQFHKMQEVSTPDDHY
jgi:hypothetical protein